MIRINIKKIKLTLQKTPLFSLSPEEIKVYFNYRLNNSLIKNQVLTINELSYLMCESGMGKLRMDPELISVLTSESIFKSQHLFLKNLIEEKQKIEKLIVFDMYSEATIKKLVKFFKNYVDSVNIFSKTPLIFEGTFNKVPVLFLIKNGEWVLPNNDLVTFVKLAQTKHRLPIFVSKKIHGILFPLFKDISIIGTNVYSNFVSNKTFDEVKRFNAKYSDKKFRFLHIKYNNRLICIDNLNEIETPLLTNFFEIHLPNIIEPYSEAFKLNNFTRITSIKGIIGDVTNKKTSQHLNKWMGYRKRLFEKLPLL